MADIKTLGPQLTKLLNELDSRARDSEKNRKYTRSKAPVPTAVENAKLVKAYRMLMGMSQAPWAGLVVDSVQDRLEVGGIRTGDKDMDKRLWREVWQANGLDADAKLSQHSILRDGRAFATVWPDDDGNPEVVYDGADTVVVAYIEGRQKQRHRVAALRRWIDDDGKKNITLYRRTELFKLREAKDQEDGELRVRAGDTWWEPRIEFASEGVPEPWPLPNPFDVVPVVELSTNRELQAGIFPYARGEFQHCHGILDRIHLLTFLGLVVALWMGFPLRYVIGDKILRDDDGKELPPFNSSPDEVVQLENDQAKIGQLAPADRGNLSILGELGQFAYVTKTPAHYFPHETGLSNISADTVRALEGALHAKVRGIHKPQIGEGHEEVLRLAGLMLEQEVKVPPTAEINWLDHESRSLAERADAATKLKDVLPPVMIAETVLGMTQEQIGRMQSELASTTLGQLLSAAQQPATVPDHPPLPAAA